MKENNKCPRCNKLLSEHGKLKTGFQLTTYGCPSDEEGLLAMILFLFSASGGVCIAIDKWGFIGGLITIPIAILLFFFLICVFKPASKEKPNAEK